MILSVHSPHNSVINVQVSTIGSPVNSQQHTTFTCKLLIEVLKAFVRVRWRTSKMETHEINLANNVERLTTYIIETSTKVVFQAQI